MDPEIGELVEAWNGSQWVQAEVVHCYGHGELRVRIPGFWLGKMGRSRNLIADVDRSCWRRPSAATAS